jgi:hypothetical protein
MHVRPAGGSLAACNHLHLQSPAGPADAMGSFHRANGMHHVNSIELYKLRNSVNIDGIQLGYSNQVRTRSGMQEYCLGSGPETPTASALMPQEFDSIGSEDAVELGTLVAKLNLAPGNHAKDPAPRQR